LFVLHGSATGCLKVEIWMMLHLANLRDVCGNVFAPVLWLLLACFLLISLGTWSVLTIGRDRGAQAASAVAFGVVLPSAFRKASLTPRFPFI
jgi:branched-subunit amino acid permease